MELIKSNKLGAIIAIYRNPPRTRGDILVVLLGTSITIILFFVGLYRAQESYTQYGPVASWDWSWSWFSFSTFSLLFTLSSIFLLINRSRFSIHVHENGLKINRFLRPYHILRWNQISGIVFTQEYTDHNSSFLNRYAIIYPLSGKPVRLTDSVMDLPELITRIKAHLYPGLLPELRSKLQDGQEIHFGSIAIHRQYLKIHRGSLPFGVFQKPWSNIVHITVSAGFLVVNITKGRPIRIPVSKIPNLELLFELIRTGVYVRT